MSDTPNQCTPVTLKDNEFYFWYSPKMAVASREIYTTDNKYIAFYKTENGEVEVTVVTKTPNSGCNWDDMQFLGVGTFSRIKV